MTKRGIPCSILFFAFALLVLGSVTSRSQEIIQAWHVIDCGGGKATAGNATIYSSAGQHASAHASTGSGGGVVVLASGFMPGLREISGISTIFLQSIDQGWNMLSVPLLVADDSLLTLYPAASSAAFSYVAGYKQNTVLQPGAGYWIKFPSESVAGMTGTAFLVDTVSVSPNWNIIGIPSSSVLTSTGITPLGTAIVSSLYGYSPVSGYEAEDTLQPGRAYWVKVSQPGQLVLSSSFMLNSADNSLPWAKAGDGGFTNPYLMPLDGREGVSRISVKDVTDRERSLYFSTIRKDLDTLQWELPPPAPASNLEIRFSTNRLLEIANDTLKEIPLVIKSEGYPVTIQWTVCEHASQSEGDAFLIIDESSIPLRSSGSVKLFTEPVDIRLQLRPASQVPSMFALSQNYPNPFNPATVIRYDLPVLSAVSLNVYNLLGQLVATIVDENQEAGYYSIRWDASTRASGVYFYSVHAVPLRGSRTSFTAMKKMLLLR